MSNLDKMLEEMKLASSLYKGFGIWERLVPQHLKALQEAGGLPNFKRTVNFHYSQWDVSAAQHPSVAHMAKLASVYPEISAATIDHIEGLDAQRMEVYKQYVSDLYRVMQGRDSLGFLEKISEPLIGNPILIRQGKRFLSQDIPINYSDFLELFPLLNDQSNSADQNTILELGAGYGCLASLIGTLNKKSRYWIVDIPPALFVAQEYIRTLFSDESIFEFKSFKSFDDIKSELDNSRFAFFTPNQLEMFPDSAIDVFVNINSFGEMRVDQVENYMKYVWRVTRKHIYLRNYDGRSLAVHEGEMWERPPVSVYNCRPDWTSVFTKTFDLFPPRKGENVSGQVKTLYSKTESD